MSFKVAIVTGSNRGIGNSIVKGICSSDFNGVVYLTGKLEKLFLDEAKCCLRSLNVSNRLFHHEQLGFF